MAYTFLKWPPLDPASVHSPLTITYNQVFQKAPAVDKKHKIYKHVKSITLYYIVSAQYKTTIQPPLNESLSQQKTPGITNKNAQFETQYNSCLTKINPSGASCI